MAIKKKVKSKRKGNVVSVDFTGVESGGRACPDGTFKAEITAAAEEESSTGNPMVVAKFKILNGKGKGALIYDNLSLQPQALFRLKALCEAVGIEAEGAADIDLDDLVGQEILVDVENETYEGKKRPRAVGYAAIDSEAEEEESEDDADSEEEEESEESEEEEDDAEEEEEKPKKSSKVKKKGKAVKEEEEEEEEAEEEEEETEEEEEDEDEEEERPTKKKVGRVNGKTSTGLAKGAKVKFKDGKTIIKGTVVSVKNKTCRVEDKNGDEYDVPSEQVELI
jgi:flagellar biosynthesis GTPase FlhF